MQAVDRYSSHLPARAFGCSQRQFSESYGAVFSARRATFSFHNARSTPMGEGETLLEQKSLIATN